MNKHTRVFDPPIVPGAMFGEVGAFVPAPSACGLPIINDFVVPFVVSAVVMASVWLGSVTAAWPHDDGRYANTPLHAWFDGLASGKGLCCSFADGFAIEDVDWDTAGPGEDDGTYRARVKGQWIVVPPAAVVAEPNRYGPAVVWPYQDSEGATQIRCFLPGAGS